MMDASIAPAAELVRRCEGCVLTAYPDPASGGEPWTIGYGSIWLDGANVRPGMRISLDQAEAAMETEIRAALATIDRLVQGLTVNQRAALASFIYNLGAGAFQASTLLRKLQAGDVNGAAAEFPKWVHAGGKVMAGLVKRREMERSLFLS